MEFTLVQSSVTDYQGAAVILPVTSEGSQPSATAQMDQKLGGFITQLIENKDLKAKAGDTIVIPQANGPRLILVGVGKLPVSGKDFIKAMQAAAKTLKGSAASDALINITGVEIIEFDGAWAHAQLAQAFQDSLYHFDECKGKKDDEEAKPAAIETLNIAGADEYQSEIQYGQAVAKGMALAKKLGDLPGNVATPSYLANEADKLASLSNKMSTTILDEDKMEELGMGSFLSVSKGSIEPGKLICMNYQGGKDGDAPHVLVGKGITFDTGGISLKPGASMDEMKYDMCGAASVLGTMQPSFNWNCLLILWVLLPPLKICLRATPANRVISCAP